MERLVVSLEEFADLAGVTAETMRGHVRELRPAAPEWVLEWGDRGRAYRIDPEGGLAWWRRKRELDDLASEERKGQLAQLRLEIVGEAGGEPDQLSLSGRQRREEIAAALELIKYRKTLGQLLERSDVERVISGAAVQLRRSLQRVAPEFGITAGLEPGQVQQLGRAIERAVDQFVTAIEKPDAFAG